MASHDAKRDASIAGPAIRASLWSSVDGAVRALVGFVITVVLARLVTPGEFGVIAMILVFSAIAGVIIDSGLGTALIQRRDTSHADESTAFYFNVAMGVLMGALLALLAPRIAIFFGQPELVGITRLMAINLVIGALGSIHTTLLMKELNFRPLMFIGLWSMALSGGLAIWLAREGYGAWALAWQVLAQTGISTVLLWAWHPWRPTRTFSNESLQGLFAFGGNVMATKLIDTVYTRLYSLLIGKLFNASALGFYTRAQTTQQLPTNLLTSVLNRVALSAFSHTAHDPRRLAAALAKTTRLLMYVNLPALTGLALTAGPVVRGLFGARWAPAIPLLQILCIVGALIPLQVLNLSALIAQGQSGLLLKVELVKKAVGTTALIIAIPFGLEAIAWSQAIASLIAFLINSHYSGRFLSFGAMAQLYALRKTFLATLAMALVVLAASGMVALAPIPKLGLLAALGACVYLVAGHLMGDRSLAELLGALRRSTRHEVAPQP